MCNYRYHHHCYRDFQVNPVTAFGMLDDLEIPEDKYVLQTAAGSVLGRMFIALAKRKGVKTINVVRRSAQKDELLALGLAPSLLRLFFSPVCLAAPFIRQIQKRSF
jgi:hypothetical protein